MRKRKIIISLIVLAFGSLLCFFIGFFYYHANSSDDTDIYEIIEKEGIDDDFSVAISDDELLLNGKMEGFIYFGRDTCPFCRLFNKYLSLISKEDTNITINKYDTDQWRETDSFDEILSKYSVNNIPLLVKVDEDGSYTTFGLSDANDIDEIYERLIDFIY